MKGTLSRDYGTFENEDALSKAMYMLGNLVIMSANRNTGLSDKPFRDKYKQLCNPENKQQKEIVAMIKDKQKPQWTKALINKRQKQLERFIHERWKI